MRKHLNSSIIIITLSAFVFISFIKQNKAQIDTPINYLALGDSYP